MPSNWSSIADRTNGIYIPDNFKQAMYQLVSHQCLYSRQHNHATSYRIISEYRDDFEEAVALMGLRLRFNDRLEYCYVVPETVKDTPLDTQETYFLLVLRQLYHMKGSVGDLTNEGDAAIGIDELISTYRSMTGKELEAKGNIIRGLVRAASKKGLAKTQDTPDGDPQPFAITILPAIADILSEHAINRFGAQLKSELMQQIPATDGEPEHEEAPDENA